MNPTPIQAARAANIVYSMLQYRRTLDREAMPPVSNILVAVMMMMIIVSELVSE